MATLSVLAVSHAGTSTALTAAASGGDKLAPGDTTWFEALNASGGSITVTIDSVRPCDQGHDHNLVVAIPSGAARSIGPLPANRFAGADGLVAVTYSSHTSLLVSAYRV